MCFLQPVDRLILPVFLHKKHIDILTFSAVPNFHHHLLGLKSKSYPCNKRHSIRVIASIPRGFLRPAEHRPVSRKVHNLQFVIAICLETRQVPVRICYALKIRSPSDYKSFRGIASCMTSLKAKRRREESESRLLRMQQEC